MFGRRKRDPEHDAGAAEAAGPAAERSQRGPDGPAWEPEQPAYRDEQPRQEWPYPDHRQAYPDHRQTYHDPGPYQGPAGYQGPPVPPPAARPQQPYEPHEPPYEQQPRERQHEPQHSWETVRTRRRGRTGLIVTACVLAAALVAAGGVVGYRHLRGGRDGGATHATAGRGTVLPLPPAPPPVLPTAGSDGATPATAAGVQAALAGPLADRRLGGRVSARVVDLTTGATLLDRGSTHMATPASTTKIVTTVAALHEYAPDHRFETTVVAGPHPGEIVLVGGGDPTLSPAPPGTPTFYPGAARLSDLAAAVRRTGTRATRVLVDTSLFSGATYAPTWLPQDIDGGYLTPITSLMADAGRIGKTDRPRSHTPDTFAATRFAADLGLPATAVAAGRAPAGARVLAKVASPPLVDILEQMLRDSDNVVGEVMIRQVALARKMPASFQGGTAAVKQALGELGVDPASDGLLDGSGMSENDRLSPRLLTSVLRVAASPDHPELHRLFPGLPVAGYDGTLATRYRTGPARSAAGVVHAKTGSLDGVNSLAGIVADPDGRLLAFAFMADKVPIGGTLDAEAALDDIAAALARCTCH